MKSQTEDADTFIERCSDFDGCASNRNRYCMPARTTRRRSRGRRRRYTGTLVSRGTYPCDVKLNGQPLGSLTVFQLIENDRHFPLTEEKLPRRGCHLLRTSDRHYLYTLLVEIRFLRNIITISLFNRDVTRFNLLVGKVFEYFL